MIKAVIFDLDGVIVSTDQLHYEAWKHVADQEDIYFDEKINHRLRGVSRMDSLNIMLEKADKTYSESEKEKLAKTKNDYYVDLLKQLSPNDMLPHVYDVLLNLKEQGIKIAIGSSSRNAKTILKYLGISCLFDAIADGTDIENSKPAPDVFLRAAEKLGVSYSSCAVIEDATVGIEAAKKAGMLAIAVFDAKKSEQADHKLDDIRDLLSIV
ncbi:beta-phosphoglucomutase [Peloplasma aerotolerans]|uniref:Beta-phosphoglucomutase n=1 Tax=Peloplasma aerotolerans TaxID=3044389 RepID=A0AAW6U6K8_9MOLU|nr:beta-phosphoglucomutase [Mariniplasma sp. M4Ah]MDI6452545.1 beta-phosphoglucomutase [Mariniplasma sp. M4Ah]